MDALWTRRSNTSKLSLSTGSPSANGAPPTNELPGRSFSLSRRHGDTSSHSTKNPFNSMSPSTTSLTSPTTGASSAFGLGSGAFASFGSSKTPKTPGGALDFSTVVGVSAKTPTMEKQVRDIGAKSSSFSIAGSKSNAPSPTSMLRNSWAFWFRPPISKSNGYVEYDKTLHEVAAFDTVQEFFDVYQHLKRPSTLPLVSDYHIFKKGIRPIWEDEENRRGGKWIVRLKKGVADRYWESLLLAIVGDQFADASDQVCGAVLSVRNGEDILSIWTRDAGGANLKIKNTMKTTLSFPGSTKIEWKSHDSSIQQRTAIDDARKEKSNQHNQHTPRKDAEHSAFSDKKQNS